MDDLGWGYGIYGIIRYLTYEMIKSMYRMVHTSRRLRAWRSRSFNIY